MTPSATKQAQKQILAALATAALALPLTLHAGEEAPKRTAPITTEPIIVSIPADAQKLDPPAPTDGQSFLVVEHLFDRLVEFHEDTTTIVPSLAKSWEFSPDNLRVTFHLREDATFSDGSPVDSAAVKYTFERVVDTKHPQHFPGIAWATDLLGDWFSRIETPDSKTAVFVLNRPYVPLLATLAIPPASIVSPKYTAATGEEVVSKPMGSGPYVLEEWKRGAYLRLKARKDYWGGHAANETIFFQVQADANQALSALRTGKTHLVTVVKPQAVKDKNALGEGMLIERTVPSIGYAVFNVKKPNLADPRIRQAMNFAIDRQNICDVLLEGTSIPAYGIIPDGMLGYTPNKEFQYRFDIAEAQRLMKEAGYGEGNPLKVQFHCFDAVRPYNTAGAKLAARLRGDLAKIYVDAEIKQMDFAGFIEFTDQRTEHEMGTIGWISDTGDPDNFIYYLFGNPSNRSNYENAEARKLMEDAQSETDDAKRAALYARAEQLMLKDPPALFINHAKWVKGASKRLRGYKQHPVAGDRMFNVWLEKK